MSKYAASREDNGLKTHTHYLPCVRKRNCKVSVVKVFFSVYEFSYFDMMVVIKKPSDSGLDMPNAAEGAVVKLTR